MQRRRPCLWCRADVEQDPAALVVRRFCSEEHARYFRLRGNADDAARRLRDRARSV